MITLEEKIERQKQVVMAAKDKYDAEMEKLHQLQKKRIELESKEVLAAFEHSSKSLEEVLAFLKNEAPVEEE